MQTEEDINVLPSVRFARFGKKLVLQTLVSRKKFHVNVSVKEFTTRKEKKKSKPKKDINILSSEMKDIFFRVQYNDTKDC